MIKRIVVCLALAGCSEPRIPAMHPASGAPLVREGVQGGGSVVFVRPPSSCDTSEYPSIVDENGHFIGNAGSNTTFTVTLPAGRHAFYSWPAVDRRSAKYPAYDPVGAVVVETMPGSVSHVAILLPKGPSLRCHVFQFELVAADEDAAARAEFESWQRQAAPVEPDAEAGERELQRDPGLVCAHLEAGRRRVPEAPATRCGGGAPIAVVPR